jgi:hypothetical protein
MSPVQNRIDAARYFLRTLVEKDPPHPEFDWLLEAFITAARSVVWVMSATAEDKEIYQEWNRLTPLPPEVAQLFRQITDLRNRIQKCGVVASKIAVTLEIDATGDAMLLMQEHSHLSEGERFEKIGDLEIDTATGRAEIRHPDGKVLTGRVAYTFSQVEEFPHEDVLDKCERYMRHLEAGYEKWKNYCSARMRGADTMGA